MTRADAIDYLTALWSSDWTSFNETIALEMAINSLKIDEMYDLERENADEFISRSVIEDIKTEIKALAKDYDLYADTRRKNGLWTALDIIDKHCGKEPG